MYEWWCLNGFAQESEESTGGRGREDAAFPDTGLGYAVLAECACCSGVCEVGQCRAGESDCEDGHLCGLYWGSYWCEVGELLSILTEEHHMLTSCREDLSVSLNFRGNHHCSTLKLRFHQLLVLFGFRPSICSLLKNAILPGSNGPAPKLLDDLMTQFSESQTAPCYLIICDGQTTAVIEKDFIGAKIRTSNEFIVHTNHDTNTDPNKPAQKESSSILGMETVVEESEERRACVQKKWDAMKKRYEKKQTEVVEKGEVVEMKVPSVREDRLREWVRAFPITNECTHFTCIMDPETARIRFLERGPDEEDDAPSMELSSW